jgi:oxygen-independent coproporphyrinogen-3 oxidase
MDGYVDRLCAELRAARAAAAGLGADLPLRVDTVYFGGGTPSLLEPGHLERIFAALRREFAVEGDAEVTLEAAPGQVAEDTLEAAMRLGVNRVSFGVQSFVDRETAAVGRLHTALEALAEMRRMRAAGVARVSLDLIAGLPYQTAESWAESLDAAVGCGADHVSVYMLEVDEDSRLGREVLTGGGGYHADALPEEDLAADFYVEACGRLEAAGLGQYEISNFARAGCASRHNLKYWYRQPYLGVGLDAHSMLLRDGADGGGLAVRWANPDAMDAYLGGPDGMGLLRAKPVVDRVGVDEAFEESFFLGLRLRAGVDLERLRVEFGPARMEGAMVSLREMEEAGMVEFGTGTVQLTESGRLASNEVFSRLLV